MIKLAILLAILAMLFACIPIWCGKLARWATDKLSGARQPRGP